MELMYITNNPEIAYIAQMAGVDRIWVDMEYIGKAERQGGLDTVQNHHTVEDVCSLRKIVNKSKLQVRVNPLYEGSKKEINQVIEAGADYIMLPMFRTAVEVQHFLSFVGGRAKPILLVETAEAVENIDSILDVSHGCEIHIGLNDLHLAYKKKFMFELLSDGTVDVICDKLQSRGYKYGFGGIARLGYGIIPAELVIAEHYRLGSTRAILSRSFCNADKAEVDITLREVFVSEVSKIRSFENKMSAMNHSFFERNRQEIISRIDDYVRSISS